MINSFTTIGIEKAFDTNEANLEPLLGGEVKSDFNEYDYGDPTDYASGTSARSIPIWVNKPFYFVISTRCGKKKSGISKQFWNLEFLEIWNFLFPAANSCPYDNLYRPFCSSARS